LPGSEGGGVADVVFGKSDFKGTLPFSWPKYATQFVLNFGDKDYDPLFAYGYGLSYAKPGKVGQVSEFSGLSAGAELPVGTWFERGKTAQSLDFYRLGANNLEKLHNGIGANGDVVRSFAVDRNRQEDSRRFLWTGTGEATVALAANAPLDLSRETNGAVSIEIDYRVDAIGEGPVKIAGYGAGLKPAGAGMDVSSRLQAEKGKGWQTMSIALSCFAKAGLEMSKAQIPLSIRTSAKLDLSISRIALGTSAIGTVSCP
jgi:beta-glucosidase